MAPFQGLQAVSLKNEDYKIVKYTQPLSPLSPAESIESLPPDTPSDYHPYVVATDSPLWDAYLTSVGIQSRLLDSGYPSPPSTSSNPKHPVSLPGFPAGETAHLDDPLYDPHYDFPIIKSCVYIGGLLDSPRVSHRVGTPAMLSSPSPSIGGEGCVFFTLPSCMEAASPHMSACSPLFSLHDALPQSPKPQPPPHPSDVESSAFHRGGLDLLSPLSPEWESNELEGYDSVRKGQSFTTVPTLPPSAGQLSTLDELDEPEREDRPSMGLSTFSNDVAACTSRPVLPLLDIPGASFTGLRSYAPSPSSPLWLAELSSSDRFVDGDILEDGDFVVSPPSSGPPDTPAPSSPLFPSDDGCVDRYFKEEDPCSLQAYFPHPSSPSIRTLPFLPDFDEYEEDYYDHNDYDNSLLQSPCSPLLRSSTDLPDLCTFENNDEHFESPSHLDNIFEDDHLFDRGLISPSLAAPLPSISPSEFTPEGLLLLNDEDPNDTDAVPSLRSPSPEYDFTLDPSILSDFPEHEEVQKLAGLQKKAQNAERMAREREQAAIAAALTAGSGPIQHVRSGDFSVLPEGTGAGTGSLDVWQLQRAASDARSVAKRERERAREVGALLRLKLKEKGVNMDFLAASHVVGAKTLVSSSSVDDDFAAGPAGQEIVEEGADFYADTPNTKMDDESQSETIAATATTDTTTIATTTVPNSQLAIVKSPPAYSSTSLLSNVYPASLTPSPASFRSKKPRVATIAQLVAKMFLNRHATPSPHFSSSSLPSSSPLSASYSSLSSGPSTSKYRSLWLRGLAAASRTGMAGGGGGGLGGIGGSTPQQPFLPYQQRYKFLRSSPLARSSVVAPEHRGRGGSRSQCRSRRTSGNWKSGGLLDDDDEEEEEEDGGFAALRTLITWGLDLHDAGEDQEDVMLPAL